MQTKNEKNYNLDFLQGKLNWNDKDPYWFRIVMALILGGVLIALVLALKFWVLPAIAGKRLLGFKLMDIIRTQKGRAP